MTHEQNQLCNLLDELTTRHDPQSLTDVSDANERLQLILDTSAYMAQLVENMRPANRVSAR